MTEPEPVLAMIAAMARDRVIGVDNRLPWHVSEDLQWFKRCTLGKPVIMGRQTWDSIGKPLPGRPNLVLSRDAGLQLPGAEVLNSTDAALARGRELARESGSDEVMVIGGAALYRAFLPLCQRLYLTELALEVDGDTVFPDWSPDEFAESNCERMVSVAGIELCFRVLERR